jgi:hypothetical protein
MTSIESKTINSSSSADFWKNHIAQWQSSGLNLASYCRQTNSLPLETPPTGVGKTYQ